MRALCEDDRGKNSSRLDLEGAKGLVAGRARESVRDLA